MACPVPSTVTLVFTDIEGSTRLWQRDAAAMSSAVARHDELARSLVQARRGRIVKTMGDGFFAVFADPADSLLAICDFQRELADPATTAGLALRVRCGIHVGEAEARDSEYFGDHVNRAARLMAAAHGGQVLVSGEVAAAVGERLPDAMDLKCLGAVKLRDFPDPFIVYQLHAPGLQAVFPPPRTGGPVPHNLPTLATSFVGRGEQVATLSELMLHHRLVTITGPGGIGKTRLAFEVASRIRERFDDGAWFIDLSGMADPALVPNAVAQVLQVPEDPGRPMLDTLVSALSTRRMLLVLDNCEHMLAGCRAVVDRILAGAPQVHTLATSREPIDTGGEHPYALPPLSTPGGAEDLEALNRFESVRLFRDRAVLRSAGFAVDAANAKPVAEICKRLDGIPLAIELAAARVRTFPVAEIARRLDRRFALLTGGGGSVLPRQQTLHAVVDWSHDLLDPGEQALFARLSVFAGGWTPESAEVVAALPAEEIDVQATLTGLARQSLVVVEAGGERHRYLETMREYAAERLRERTEAATIADRHCAFFVDFSEQAESPAVAGKQQGAWFGRVAAEMDNLRAALEHAISGSADTSWALRVCGALYRHWMMHGQLREGHDWCTRAIAAAGAATGHVSAKAWLAIGALTYRLGDLPGAKSFLESALAADAEASDPSLLTRIFNNLALIAQEQGDTAGAMALYARAASAARAGVPPALEARILSNLGNLNVNEGRLAEGEAILERALVLARAQDDDALVAQIFSYLESAATYGGDPARALAYNDEVLALARALDFKEMLTEAANSRGEILLAQGDLPGAHAQLLEAARRVTQDSAPFQIATVLDTIAKLAFATRAHAEAARWAGAADGVWESLGTVRTSIELDRFETMCAVCGEAIGKAAFDAARLGGRAMSSNESIEAACVWLAGSAGISSSR